MRSKKIIIILISIILFIIFMILLQNVEWSIRVGISLMLASIILWTFEPIPFSQTSMLLMVLFIIFGVADTTAIVSGFSSNALFLILGGLMIARAVNSTYLGERLALWILQKISHIKGGLLFGVIIIQQILSIFVPTPSIRTTLLLPVLESIFQDTPKENKLKKQVMLGAAYGGSISSIGLLPSGLMNIMMVEFINIYTGIYISYVQWFLIMGPLWLLLIPITWFAVLKSQPIEQDNITHIQNRINSLRNEVIKMDQKEIRLICLVGFIVLLWGTHNIHGVEPAYIALLGAILLSFPIIGVIHWREIIKINIDIILIIGATFSIGNALNDSGTALYLASNLNHPIVLGIFKNEIIGILLIIFFVQLYHKIVTNIGTAIVTLLPIILSFSTFVGLDPVKLAFITNATLAMGFILVIESMPNVIVHSAGLLKQKDFFKSGIILTLLTSLTIFLVSITWWEWIPVILDKYR